MTGRRLPGAQLLQGCREEQSRTLCLPHCSLPPSLSPRPEVKTSLLLTPPGGPRPAPQRHKKDASGPSHFSPHSSHVPTPLPSPQPCLLPRMPLPRLPLPDKLPRSLPDPGQWLRSGAPGSAPGAHAIGSAAIATSLSPHNPQPVSSQRAGVVLLCVSPAPTQSRGALGKRESK